MTGGDNTISGAIVAASSLIKVTNPTTLTLSGGTLAAGAIVETTSGGDLFVNGRPRQFRRHLVRERVR